MTVRIITGDCRDALAQLPDESVHCVVTSPPYWGLRTYGGDAGMIGLEPTRARLGGTPQGGSPDAHPMLRDDGTVWLNYGDSYVANAGDNWKRKHWKRSNIQSKHHGTHMNYRNKAQGVFKPKDLMMMPARLAIALQEDGWWVRSDIIWHKPNPTPESVTDRPTTAHEHVFLLTKSPDALYWTHPERAGAREKPAPHHEWRYRDAETGHVVRRTRTEPDGWEDDDDWQRVNLWTGHKYFYDEHAVRTPIQPQSLARITQSTFDEQTGGAKDPKDGNRSHRKILENQAKRVPASWASSPSYEDQDPRYRKREHKFGRAAKNDAENANGVPRHRSSPPKTRIALLTGANLRNVWSIPTQPYADAHFAVMPPGLIEPCIKAGTSEHGVCDVCGAPYERRTNRVPMLDANRPQAARAMELADQHGLTEAHFAAIRAVGVTTDANYGREVWDGYGRGDAHTMALVAEAKAALGSYLREFTFGSVSMEGWERTCAHDSGIRRSVVLDPFGGAGTVGLVADRLQRDAILIEVNGSYADMSRKRIASEAGLFADIR